MNWGKVILHLSQMKSIMVDGRIIMTLDIIVGALAEGLKGEPVPANEPVEETTGHADKVHTDCFGYQHPEDCRCMYCQGKAYIKHHNETIGGYVEASDLIDKQREVNEQHSSYLKIQSAFIVFLKDNCLELGTEENEVRIWNMLISSSTYWRDDLINRLAKRKDNKSEPLCMCERCKDFRAAK